MEHLETYIVPRLKLLKVPVLKNDRFAYDSLGFDGFPERVSFDVRELWNPSDTDQLNGYDRLSFLQNWLYFAFAHEIFGRILADTPTPLDPRQLMSTTNHDDEPAGGQIDSSKVILAATTWMALDEMLTPEESKEIMYKTIAVLKQVHGILRAVLFAMDGDCQPYMNIALDTANIETEIAIPVSHSILISILLLGEQIDRAFNSIYSDPRFRSRQLGWPINKALLGTYMKLTGCCRTEISYLVRGSCNSNTLLSWQFLMRQVLPQRDHTACTADKCNSGQRFVPQPQHVDENCDCPSVCLSPQAQQYLTTLVRAGRIPMLKATKVSDQKQEVCLQVAEFVPNDKKNVCIAISHVWSDGLGNPRDNTIPCCQIRKLQQLSQEIAKRVEGRFQFRKRTIGFWIDTICIPMDEALKRQAILQMRNIYKDTSAVLVLDKAIQQVSTDPGSLSTMWQIYTSIWYRRLWTLQEGILNTKTFVRLSDDLPTFEWFVHSYDACSTLEQPLNACRNFIKAHIYPSRTAHPKPYSAQLLDPIYHHLRLDLLETRRTITSPEYCTSRILHQLAWRDASVRNDESVCLAVLSSYPITPSFLARPPSAQLATVIHHLGSCPSIIAFLPGPRLSIPGSRWVPQSFLNSRFSLQRPWSFQIAQTTPDGLLACLPAMVQKNKSVVFRNAVPGSALLSDGKLLLTVNGHEYNVTTLDGAEGFYEAFFLGDLGGILLLEEKFGMEQPPNTVGGLVARVERVNGDITHVTPLKACLVHTQESVYNEMELSTELGFVKDADRRKPMLEEGAIWAASMKSEAEILESRMYCIG